MRVRYYKKQLDGGKNITGVFRRVDDERGMFKILIVSLFKNELEVIHSEFVNKSKEGYESMTNLVEAFYAREITK